MRKFNLNCSASRIVMAASIGLLAMPNQALAQSELPTAEEEVILEELTDDTPEDPLTGNDDSGDPAIVVTGSRIVSGAAAPTPLTTVSTEVLAATTPSNIPDALNKLPLFQGSQVPRAPGSGRTLQASNVLSLRNFGAERTLVLFNGNRIPPSNADGTVNVDIIPQMLVERVDTITGGASAVYGSDAVSGVINFILDEDFSGVRTDVAAGVSTYGDGERYRFGIAAGRSLFDGRGHIMGSFRMEGQSLVDNFDRPYGDETWVLTGNGTESNPRTATINTRRADSAFGGLVQNCRGTGCPPNQTLHFISDGVLAPFDPGYTTGTRNQNSGGDGARGIYGTAVPEQESLQTFARFSYELTDDINFYVQGAYSTYSSLGWHFPTKLTPGNGQASTFFKNNAFLSPTVRAQLGDNGLSDATNTFQLGTYIISTGKEGQNGTKGANEYYNVMAGLSGGLGAFDWNVFLSRGQNDQRVTVFNNPNYQRQFAALDAVLDSKGVVRCYASLQPNTAAEYADCVPLNAFGPTAITQHAHEYFVDDTFYDQINAMDNIGASITGPLFDNWAGPVLFALSAEARWQSYELDSSDEPAAKVDCTGLRICNPKLALYAQPVQADLSANSHVWEVAGELNIPLLQDVFAVQDLSLALAARYTDYSTSGSVVTWKAGVDWQMFDAVRLRATASRDIRAPTLDDLYKPPSSSVTGFVDSLTGTSNTLFQTETGNPDLVPEVARTYTAGIVVTPLAGLTASLDYYQFTMNNAIGDVSAGNLTVQRICIDSGGTHPYCDLFTRPFPYTNTTPANFPTEVRNLLLNTSSRRAKGFDAEIEYRFEALSADWGVRLFGNYQPVNEQVAIEGTPPTQIVGSEKRLTGVLSYANGPVGINVLHRWLSEYDRRSVRTEFWADPFQDAYQTTDVNFQYDFDLAGSESQAFFTVENLFDTQPEVSPGSGSVGIGYPVPAGYNLMGRYFTVGLRSRW
jgi:outer membrane receptor protein involved in Fe transport